MKRGGDGSLLAGRWAERSLCWNVVSQLHTIKLSVAPIMNVQNRKKINYHFPGDILSIFILKIHGGILFLPTSV